MTPSEDSFKFKPKLIKLFGMIAYSRLTLVSTTTQIRAIIEILWSKLIEDLESQSITAESTVEIISGYLSTFLQPYMELNKFLFDSKIIDILTTNVYLYYHCIQQILPLNIAVELNTVMRGDKVKPLPLAALVNSERAKKTLFITIPVINEENKSYMNMIFECISLMLNLDLNSEVKYQVDDTIIVDAMDTNTMSLLEDILVTLKGGENCDLATCLDTPNKKVSGNVLSLCYLQRLISQKGQYFVRLKRRKNRRTGSKFSNKQKQVITIPLLKELINTHYKLLERDNWYKSIARTLLNILVQDSKYFPNSVITTMQDEFGCKSAGILLEMGYQNILPSVHKIESMINTEVESRTEDMRLYTYESINETLDPKSSEYNKVLVTYVKHENLNNKKLRILLRDYEITNTSDGIIPSYVIKKIKLLKEVETSSKKESKALIDNYLAPSKKKRDKKKILKKSGSLLSIRDRRIKDADYSNSEIIEILIKSTLPFIDLRDSKEQIKSDLKRQIRPISQKTKNYLASHDLFTLSVDRFFSSLKWGSKSNNHLGISDSLRRGNNLLRNKAEAFIHIKRLKYIDRNGTFWGFQNIPKDKLDFIVNLFIPENHISNSMLEEPIIARTLPVGNVQSHLSQSNVKTDDDTQTNQ